jgi:hypothetical protein
LVVPLLLAHREGSNMEKAHGRKKKNSPHDREVKERGRQSKRERKTKTPLFPSRTHPK